MQHVPRSCHQASSLPPFLVASAQRGPLRDGLCSVISLLGGWWMDAWLMKVSPCTVQAFSSPTLLLCSAQHPHEHMGDTTSWGLLSYKKASLQSWSSLGRGVVLEEPHLSKTGKCPEDWQESTAFLEVYSLQISSLTGDFSHVSCPSGVRGYAVVSLWLCGR